MGRIRVLSPIGVMTSATFAAPGLPRGWEGRTIGVLDNTKTNFDRLAGEIGTLLRAQLGVKTMLHRRKANASTGAAPEIIAELHKECDVVFAGSAD